MIRGRVDCALPFAVFTLLMACGESSKKEVESAPAKVEPARPAEAECIGKLRLRGLVFGHGDAKIAPHDRVMLDLVADAIQKSCAGKTITIEGHTSVLGPAAFNQKLSEQRAEAVKSYLVEYGVPADQLRAVGYGETRPLTSDPSPEAQKMNRRVTLVAQ
jgi:outer membrane protein OmpA-like peptidoglycan-associated protein